MKWTLFLLVIVSSVVWADGGLSQTEKSIGSASASSVDALPIEEKILHINEALKSYREDYLKRPTHKAFAQAPDGTWSWRSDRTSIEFAKQDALLACNDAIKGNKLKCEIINLDGEWVIPNPALK